MLRVGLTDEEADQIRIWHKLRDKRGHELPEVYAEFVLAERLGLRTWDDVLDMPHLELMLRIDLLRIESEVAQWRRDHPDRG